jgi:hypothetical protein
MLEAERTGQRGRTPSIIIAPSVLSADSVWSSILPRRRSLSNMSFICVTLFW